MITAFSNILNQIPCRVFWKDRNSVFLGCNSYFAKAAGFESPEEIIGKTDFDLVWGETHAQEYQEGDREVILGKKKYNVIEPQLQTNGEVIDTIGNKLPLYDKTGQVIGVIGCYSEIIYTPRNEPLTKKNGKSPLPKRQAECLYYVAKGKTAKQISIAMGISSRTVDFYIEILKTKFDCYSKSDLAEHALSLDYIKDKLLKR